MLRACGHNAPDADSSTRGAVAMSIRSDVHLYRRVLHQARPHWIKLAAIFGIDLLASPVSLLTPVPLKIAVDSVIGTHPLPKALHTVLPEAVINSRAGVLGTAVVLLMFLAVLTQIRHLATV